VPKSKASARKESCCIVSSGPRLSNAAEFSMAPRMACMCPSSGAPSSARRFRKSLKSPPGDRAVSVEDACESTLGARREEVSLATGTEKESWLELLECPACECG